MDSGTEQAQALALSKTDCDLHDWNGNTVQELLDRLQQQAAETARPSAALKHANAKNQALTLELAHLRRIRFGVKSEALTAEQRDLFQETLDADIAACEAEAEAAVPEAKPQAKRPRAGRQPLPEHLPRIEHRHEPESRTCGQCGGNLVKIGEDISEQLDVEPARFFVHRHIRPQYACRACETITAAPVPAAIIDGGLAAPGLLAWVAIGKFADHLPLYRIEQIAARQEVILPRSTLAEWMGRVGVALSPLADRLAERLKQSPVLHADETPVAQLDPGAGKTKRATLWAYHSNRLAAGPPIVVFDYQASRSGSHAGAFLAGWQGHLMVDDYAGYKALFKSGIMELACLAHARRKFFDLYAANQSPIAQEALGRIGKLYAIEEAGRGLDTDSRQALRQREAKPVLDALFAWLYATRQGRGRRQRQREGDRLQPETLGGADPLCGFGRSADRQQSGRERDPADRHRQEELAVRRLGAGRETRGGNPEPDRHRPAQRPRPRRLAAGNPGEAAGLAE